MRKGHRFVALPAVALCLLLCSSRAASQSPPIVSYIVAPINQLSIGDIDFRHSPTPKWLFTITIRAVNPDSIRVTMKVRIGFELPGIRYDDALTFSTRPFDVRGQVSISNLDLDRGVYQLDQYTLRQDAKRTLEAIALPTGQIPAGTYSFNVEVIPVGGSSTGSTTFSIVLTNPTAVELISPMDGDQFATQFPLFQWVYDGPSSRISIYEKLPGQASLEEAASGIPQYSTVSTSNSLQYPSSGARLLEPGKTYVWYVEGLSAASGGTTVGRKSALRSFTVGSGSNTAQSLSSILDDLARAMPQYQSLFDGLRSQGFTTAGSLRLNGATISVSDLQQLLNTLRTNPEAVTSVVLE